MLNKNREYNMDKQILGQCKVQPQAESVGFTSRFSRRHCLFLLNRGGAMGKQCLTCPDFVQRQQNADLLETAFGQSGVWDYKTCHTTCWREEDKHSAYQREWARKKSLELAVR